MMYKIEIVCLDRDLIEGSRFHKHCVRDSKEECMEWYERKRKAGRFGKDERWMHEDDMSEWEKQRVKKKKKAEDGKWNCLVPKDWEAKLYKVSDYKENRRKEYPTMNEILEALVENMEMRPQKLEQIKMRREMVRKKYPKNEEELLETL